MAELSLFLPIEKIDDEQRMVWGYASTPTRDLDNEIVKVDAIKEALPDYMKWANIREMHQPKAVGVATEATVEKGGLYIGARIVDDTAWKKVKEKVYKGFSIGGRVVSKVDDTITKLRMTEISLVDRPANPDCKIDVFKVAGKPVAFDLPSEGDDAPEVKLDAKERGFIGRLLQKLMGTSSLQKDYNPSEARDARGEWTAGDTGAAAAKPEEPRGPKLNGKTLTLTNHPLIWALGATAIAGEIMLGGGPLIAAALTAAGGWGLYAAQKMLDDWQHIQRLAKGEDGAAAEAIDKIRNMAPEEIVRRADKLPDEDKERLAHLLAMHMSREQIMQAYNEHGPGKDGGSMLEDVAETDGLEKFDESKHPRGAHGQFGSGYGTFFGWRHPSGDVASDVAFERERVRNRSETEARAEGAARGVATGAAASLPIGAASSAIAGERKAFPIAAAGGAFAGGLAGWHYPELFTGDRSDWNPDKRVEHGPPADLAEEDEDPSAKMEQQLDLFKDAEPAADESAVEKSMQAVNHLSNAFDTIRWAQRALVMEGHQEQDAVDQALADKIGGILSEISGVIADISHHEAGEAIDYSDVSDQWLPKHQDDEGELSMSADAEDLAKRVAAHVKMSVAKACDHMSKASDCHAMGMQTLQKCYGMMNKADGVSKGQISELVKKAAGHFEQSSNHSDIASHHMQKAAKSFGTWGSASGSLPNSVGGSIEENDQSKMTEGSVQEYPNASPYKGKTFTQQDLEKAATEAAEKATLKAQNESLLQQVETLSKLPAGSPRARAAAIGQSHFAPGGTVTKDATSLLMKGVEAYDVNDPDQRDRAAARMLGNMVVNPDVFAKSVTDPSFRGGALKRAA